MPNMPASVCLDSRKNDLGTYATNQWDRTLAEYFPDDATVHIGQPEVATLVMMRQAFVVYAEQVQDRGIQIVDMNSAARDVVAKVVGGAMAEARLDSSTCHEDRETTAVVVAPVVVCGQLALAINGPSELTTPHHQGVFEQAPLFEIGDQRCTR